MVESLFVTQAALCLYVIIRSLKASREGWATPFRSFKNVRRAQWCDSCMLSGDRDRDGASPCSQPADGHRYGARLHAACVKASD